MEKMIMLKLTKNNGKEVYIMDSAVCAFYKSTTEEGTSVLLSNGEKVIVSEPLSTVYTLMERAGHHCYDG